MKSFERWMKILIERFNVTAHERKECRLSVMISRSLCCLASTLLWSMEHNFSNLALQFLHFTAGSWEAVTHLPRMQVAEHRAAFLHLWTFCIHILRFCSFILGQPPPLFISHFTTSMSKRQYAESYVQILLNTQTTIASTSFSRTAAVKSFRLGRLQHNEHKEMATNYINHRWQSRSTRCVSNTSHQWRAKQ